MKEPEISNSEIFVCKICEKGFVSQIYLNQHYKIRHPVGQEKHGNPPPEQELNQNKQNKFEARESARNEDNKNENIKKDSENIQRENDPSNKAKNQAYQKKSKSVSRKVDPATLPKEHMESGDSGLQEKNRAQNMIERKEDPQENQYFGNTSPNHVELKKETKEIKSDKKPPIISLERPRPRTIVYVKPSTTKDNQKINMEAQMQREINQKSPIPNTFDTIQIGPTNYLNSMYIPRGFGNPFSSRDVTKKKEDLIQYNNGEGINNNQRANTKPPEPEDVKKIKSPQLIQDVGESIYPGPNAKKIQNNVGVPAQSKLINDVGDSVIVNPKFNAKEQDSKQQNMNSNNVYNNCLIDK